MSEAEEIISRFAAVSSDEARILEMRTDLAFGLGKLAEAVKFARAAIEEGSTSPWPPTYAAYSLNASGKTEEGIALLPSAFRPIVANYWRGRYRQAADAATADGVEFWDSAFVAPPAAKALAHAGENGLLLRLFDQRWRSPSEFTRTAGCTIYLQAPTLILAMREAGRRNEANELLSAALAEHRKRLENGYTDPGIHATAAALLMLQGRPEPALAKLEEAVAKGWVNQGDPWSTSLNDPVFVPLRSAPRFQMMVDQLTASVQQAAVSTSVGRTSGR